MYLVPRWADRNLSRLELVSAWILILVLIGTFTRHMLIVFARAEQSMVERTVMNIDAMLGFKAGMARMKGEYETIGQLIDGNPVTQIQSFNSEYVSSTDAADMEKNYSRLTILSVLSNYGGEIDNSGLDSAKRGYWYYNKEERTLIYIIRNSEFFFNEVEGKPRLRYQVTIDFFDKNGNGKFDPDVDKYRSLGLISRDSYKWFN